MRNKTSIRLLILLFLTIGSPALPSLASPPDGVQASNNAERVLDIFVKGPPLEVHSKGEGWSEYPSLAISDDFCYVAYDVRRGDRSQLYVCVIPRAQDHPRLNRLTIANGQECEFAPSIALSDGGGLWLAWNSYRDNKWSVWASGMDNMRFDRPVLISEEGSLCGQVSTGAGEAAIWFAWIQWQRGTYEVVARQVSEGEMKRPVTVYAGVEPVGRPDILVLEDDHVVIVWDEFTGERWVVRWRDLEQGKLGEVRTLSGQAYANEWQPHVTGSEEGILVTRHRVPGVSDRCQPAVALLEGMDFNEGIDLPEDDETWRVECFSDNDGSTWIAWAARRGYRRTNLFARRISDKSFSRTCKLVFPMARTFINTFDCACDDELVLAYEHSGSIFLYELALPNLPDVGLPAGASASPSHPSAAARPTAVPDLRYATCYAGESLQVYFGDDHNHTSFSDGRAYPDISMMLARRWRNLDFMAITDHDITLTPGEFAWTSAVSALLSDSGRFVCIPGFEEGWGWAKQDYGHWTVLFPHEGELLLFEDGMVPEDLFAFGRKHNAVLIPHHVGISWASHDWDHFDPGVEPVAEICSKHGVFESMEGNETRPDVVEGSFIQDGLARGHRFGLIGASDSHNCFEAMGIEFGLMGVYASSLTRSSVLEAIRRKRTYALTGERIIIDFRCNGKFMGETIHRSDILLFDGYVTSAGEIRSVDIVSNGQVVHHADIGAESTDFSVRLEAPRQEVSYYYLRVETASGHRAWSSPIWISP